MINLILSETKRSEIYLKELIKNKVKINAIILYSKSFGRVYELINKKKLNKININCKTNNINSEKIYKKLSHNKAKINIVSTYSGEIVKNPSLLKKKLYHCHPGDLPKFKGSTTIYYAVILKKKIFVSIFQMGKKIDEGKLVYKKKFNYPKNFKNIERSFDNNIRALTLIDFIKKKKIKKYNNIKNNYLPYYIVHPIIRQIVLNKKSLK
tara:strand:- start:16913 stop:17539 length:627 start_codon:yes stop_codon:yes gene_type:complete